MKETIDKYGVHASNIIKSLPAIKGSRKLNALLKKLGFVNVKTSQGYHYASGFATNPYTGGIFYFSVDDVRWSCERPLLMRSATSYNDYSGGINRYPISTIDIKQIAGL